MSGNVFNILVFLPLSFSEVETACEMTKTMLEWVFYLLTLVADKNSSCCQ